tara:strand:+ start:676 stop:1074 length:399 start_codon:yes stop_codon:yes gene_type:complete
MIIKAIKTLLEPKRKITEDQIQCAIDEQIVDCEGEAFKQDALNYYTGVPAPVYLEDDPWFGPAPARSQKQLDYIEQETFIKQQQAQEVGKREPDNIHQLMYEIATKSSATTLQLDPVGGSENFQGGSENFHE